MHTRRSFVAVFGLSTLAASAVPALAHHGWGGNLDEEFEISGTVVTGVSLAGPHATMKMKYAEGHVWDLTLAPPFMTERSGLKEGSIPAGSKVSIHGHRNRDPKKFEIKTERITVNGKTYNVYPDRT